MDAALYFGPVISGEMGNIGSKVVYLGNTTAHMEKLCTNRPRTSRRL